MSAVILLHNLNKTVNGRNNISFSQKLYYAKQPIYKMISELNRRRIKIDQSQQKLKENSSIFTLSFMLGVIHSETSAKCTYDNDFNYTLDDIISDYHNDILYIANSYFNIQETLTQE